MLQTGKQIFKPTPVTGKKGPLDCLSKPVKFKAALAVEGPQGLDDPSPVDAVRYAVTRRFGAPFGGLMQHPVSALTVALERAAGASGIACCTDGCPEIHQCLIPGIGAPGRKHESGKLPGPHRPPFTGMEPPEHSPYVRVDDGDSFSVGEGGDRMRCVPTDPGEAHELLRRARELPRAASADGLRQLVESDCPGVVAEPVPGPDHISPACPCKRGQGGEAMPELGELSHDAVHLGLLEHHFGQEDDIWIFCAAPGEIPPVLSVPLQKGSDNPWQTAAALREESLGSHASASLATISAFPSRMSIARSSEGETQRTDSKTLFLIFPPNVLTWQ